MTTLRELKRGPITWMSFDIDLDEELGEPPREPHQENLSSVQSGREPTLLADRIERIDHAITAQDLARVLNVSRIMIFKRAKAGRIPSFRIGTSVRFCPKAVADWLRKQ